MTDSAAAASSRYAAGFLESSLGLVSDSLKTDEVPKDLLEELTSVMRGALPKDPTRPFLEARISRFLADLERSAIEEQGFFVHKARWPHAAPAAVCLTHDVDNLERPLEHILKIKDRFEGRDVEMAIKGSLSLYDNIKLVSRNEAARGLRSSFYLLSANYPLDRVRETALALSAKGWEFGLHGDFGTHDSEPEMRKAVERFREGVGIQPRGLREHYLKFDFGSSWQIMEDAGFDYDTTVGNNDALGFRLGLATPFHPPDLGWRPMRLLEIPLSLMDTTLWGYLKKGEEEGYEDVMAMMRKIEEVEGLFTLLWHQEAVRMKGGRIYWRILRELSRRNRLFVGTGLDVARWWRAREVALMREGGAFRLAGRAPKGLTIIVRARPGTKMSVASGSMTKRSRAGRKERLVAPTGRSFRLRVSGAK